MCLFFYDRNTSQFKFCVLFLLFTWLFKFLFSPNCINIYFYFMYILCYLFWKPEIYLVYVRTSRWRKVAGSAWLLLFTWANHVNSGITGWKIKYTLYTMSRLYHCQFSCLVHIRTDLDLLNCFMPSKYLSWSGCNTPLKKFQLARMTVFWQTLISGSASIENIIFCKKCDLYRVVYYLLLITYVIIKNSGGSERGPKFFQFHVVFEKIWQNRMLTPP